MPENEEDLLRSIEEVEAKIQDFRDKVRAVLEAVQADGDGATAESDVKAAG
jgi:hypothetical protein